MTAKSDPIGGDAPRIILPTPGRKRVVEDLAPAAPPPDLPEDDGLSVSDITHGFRLEGGEIPVMVTEAAPLLNLANAMRRKRAAPDIAALRRDTIAAIKTYEKQLSAAGILPEQARAAHYVVCATVDDVIRNTPWGGDWSVEGLVSTFHHDVTGGDKVFELLAYFQNAPGANRDLLLLIYLCLSLGFEGRTRVSPRGALELSQIRDNLYRILRGQFGMPERDLSPSWKGEAAAHERLRAGRRFWLIAGLLLLGMALLFGGFTMRLGQSADETIAQMAALPPDTPPSLFIPEPPLPVVEEVPESPPLTPPPEDPKPKDVDAIAEFMSFLKPEVDEGLVRLYRDGDAVLVRIANSGAFQRAQAEIDPAFEPIFNRIGEALAVEDFDVIVFGHTDNIPIRDNFPSNFHLSNARARAVHDILVGHIEANRITVRGVADLCPIADNGTEAGREANRRTEILVIGAGSSVAPSMFQEGTECVNTSSPAGEAGAAELDQ
ncbi:type IVB secretion system protein IcmH/DotU [Tabrizicola sp.]|uniref:type IVB secretion system protein IcmH/DotU n=1 Tax=Tabrizicola sp. TaxID=2005166 RepID=UPI003F384C47